jgi:phospholipase C
MTAGLDRLKHIVVLMMENRSFDHMLGALKQRDKRINGLNGDEWNPDSNGKQIVVQPLVADCKSGDLPDYSFTAPPISETGVDRFFVMTCAALAASLSIVLPAVSRFRMEVLATF